MQKQLLADYAPASVLINRKFEVLCFQGPTVDYLEFPSGEPTRDLLALARPGLRTRLRALVAEAIRTGDAVTDANLRVKRHEPTFPVRSPSSPSRSPRKPTSCCWSSSRTDRRPLTTASPPAESAQESSLMSQLENELKATREDLQGTIEELESSNEEMKASNEEMMSMNEELQSVNEELETSKEELQSTNEELNTVNNQLNLKLVGAERDQQRHHQSAGQHRHPHDFPDDRLAHSPVHSIGHQAVSPAGHRCGAADRRYRAAFFQ